MPQWPFGKKKDKKDKQPKKDKQSKKEKNAKTKKSGEVQKSEPLKSEAPIEQPIEKPGNYGKMYLRWTMDKIHGVVYRALFSHAVLQSCPYTDPLTQTIWQLWWNPPRSDDSSTYIYIYLYHFFFFFFKYFLFLGWWMIVTILRDALYVHFLQTCKQKTKP